MDYANKAILENIRSGQYFLDSRNWYINKYVFPLVERTYIILFASFAFVTVLILFAFHLSIINSNNQLYFTKYVNNIATQYSAIAPIKSETNNPQTSVENFLVANYVKLRETYNYSNLENQIIGIKNHSSENEFRKFLNYISINNPNSPVLIYQDKGKRIINIDSIKFENTTSQIAKVYFTSYLIVNNNNRDQIITKYIATVEFSLPKIENLLKKGENKLDFTVKDYKLQLDN